jgi:hypothetical protein
LVLLHRTAKERTIPFHWPPQMEMGRDLGGKHTGGPLAMETTQEARGFHMRGKSGQWERLVRKD